MHRRVWRVCGCLFCVHAPPGQLQTELKKRELLFYFGLLPDEHLVCITTDVACNIPEAYKQHASPLPFPFPTCASQGRMQGPDVGDLLSALALESGSDVADRSSFVPVAQRIEALRQWVAAQQS